MRTSTIWSAYRRANKWWLWNGAYSTISLMDSYTERKSRQAQTFAAALTRRIERDESDAALGASVRRMGKRIRDEGDVALICEHVDPDGNGMVEIWSVMDIGVMVSSNTNDFYETPEAALDSLPQEAEVRETTAQSACGVEGTDPRSVPHKRIEMERDWIHDAGPG